MDSVEGIERVAKAVQEIPFGTDSELRSRNFLGVFRETVSVLFAEKGSELAAAKADFATD